MLLRLMKRMTGEVYERGKSYVANVDGFDFLHRPLSSLTTDDEKAGFHFVVQRPWRESAIWFGNLIDTKDDLDAGRIEDPEARAFAEWAYHEMVASPSMPLVRKLKGIPAAVRDHKSRAYRTWAEAHNSLLRAYPSAPIGVYVSESSKAASLACCGSRD